MPKFIKPSVQFHMDLAKAALTAVGNNEAASHHVAADAWQLANAMSISIPQSVRDELERADARWLAELRKPE